MAKKLPAKRRSSARSGRYDRYIIGGIIVALIAIVLVLWGPLRQHRVAEEKKPAVQAKKIEPALPPKKAEKRTPKKVEESPVPKPLGKTALVAIVIDDLGQDLKQAQEILSLRAKITLAIMPGLAQSKKIAEQARQHNREVLLHLPMEYKGKNGKPAPGMLRSDMTPMEFLSTLSDDLGSVPGAVGVNNHEGSSLTENKEAMKFLMAELKARNLLFLDSFTSPKSVAHATAKEFGLKTAKRDVFLDNEGDNPAYIRKQLDELADLAKKYGKAVGIGHPHPVTISELRQWLAQSSAQGIEVVPVSRIVN
jgi:polysaccharide deacetylase 2 family uncharacterized protein YibQ